LATEEAVHERRDEDAAEAGRRAAAAAAAADADRLAGRGAVEAGREPARTEKEEAEREAGLCGEGTMEARDSIEPKLRIGRQLRLGRLGIRGEFR
jgi:hypothetical protein